MYRVIALLIAAFIGVGCTAATSTTTPLPTLTPTTTLLPATTPLPDSGPIATPTVTPELSDVITTILRNNVSACFTLVGTLMGALLTGIVTHLGARSLEKREARHRILEKILDQRIEAHETVARWAEKLGHSYVIGHHDNAQKTPVAASNFMLSPKSYAQWANEYTEIVNRHRVWLSAEASEELATFQVYMQELESILDHGYRRNIWAVGAIIIEDFAVFSVRVHNVCYRYFAVDLPRLELPLKEQFLSPGLDPARRNRITGTVLFSKRQTIERLVKTDPSEIEKRLPFVLSDHFREQLKTMLEENSAKPPT